MKGSRWRQVTALTLVAALTLSTGSPAFAHNERIHQAMTDYAYHLAVAMAQVPAPPGQENALNAELATLLGTSGMPAFFAAAKEAVPKLRKLAGGLPDDPKPCLDPATTALVDDNNDLLPDWQLPSGTLPEQPLGGLVYPVTVRYAHKNVACEIDRHYQPIGATKVVNPVQGATPKEQFRSRDYTGVTLGYWAGGPDRALKDWIFRSTTLETIQHPAVKIPLAAGASALVAAACLIACGLFPVLCLACPALAVGAGGAVIDAIDDLDASSMEHDDFTGLGHHIDMKALDPGAVAFDEKPGKFMERAGPAGNPDLLEECVVALYDLLGWHVRHDLSQGPANYQIFLAGTPADDFHTDTTPRSAANWETPTGGHLQYTPLDNLAVWGWNDAKAATQPGADPALATLPAARLGWALHAFGDATSPMHLVGATGYGHRPYEESVDNKWNGLVFAEADESTPGPFNMSLRQAREIVARALAWRQFILQWRAAHGATKDVPVRDMVTALAAAIEAKSAGQAGLFDPAASIEWQFGSESAAEAVYDGASMTAFQRDTLLDGVAAKLAFLVSAPEVMP